MGLRLKTWNFVAKHIGNYIEFSSKGDFSKTRKALNRMYNMEYLNVLEKYGQQGVAALSAATPVDSGKTASSWNYEIKHDVTTTTITWTNSNINKGHKIAILLQYGHGTRQGGYVRGIDYINPAMRPIFEQMANEAWKEVTKE